MAKILLQSMPFEMTPSNGGSSGEITKLFHLVNARGRDWENRRRFFAFAARTMRRRLIDQARARPNGDARRWLFERLDTGGSGPKRSSTKSS